MKDIDLEDELCNFIKDFGDDLCGLELLLFFSRHHNARFNRPAVLNALTVGQFDTGIALKHLIDKKMVITSIEHGVTLYALTREEPVYSLAKRLINVDQHQWQILIEHLLNAQGV